MSPVLRTSLAATGGGGIPCGGWLFLAATPPSWRVVPSAPAAVGDVHHDHQRTHCRAPSSRFFAQLPGPPGEHLGMQVAVTVPRHVRLMALWVGICKDSWGWRPGDRPTGMSPILISSRQPLPAGVHTFGVRWRFPAGQSGTSLDLSTAWLSQLPPLGIARAIAVLALN